MKKPEKNKPEIYAVKKNKQVIGFERRDFLKKLGTLTSATLVGCNDISQTKTTKTLGENSIVPQKIEPCNDLNAHANAVQSLCFTADGKILASGSSDYSIKTWSVPDGKLLKKLEGHTDTVNSVSISRDGKTIASGSVDQTIKLWSVPKGELLKTIDENNSNILCVCISPDGKTLASGGSDNSIRIWSVPEGKLLKTLEGHTDFIRSVCFSNDGKYLASGSDDHSVKLWSVMDGNLLNTIKGPVNAVSAVCFSPDGKILASCGYLDPVRLWSVPGGDLLKELGGNQESINSICFSPDGNFLASGGYKSIKIWSVRDGVQQKAIEGHSDEVRSVCFSPAEKLLASASKDKSIKIWQWLSDEELKPDGTYREVVNELALPCAESGNFLALRQNATDTGKIRIFDLGESNFIYTVIARTSVTAMAISSSAKVLIVGDFNGTVKSWDLENRKKRPSFKAHAKHISAILLKKDNKEFITASYDGTIGIWSMSDNKCLRTLDIQMGPIQQVFLGPDEKTLIIGSNRMLQIWSMETFTRIRTIDDFQEETQENNMSSYAPTTGDSPFFQLSAQSTKILVKTPAGFVIYDYEKGTTLHTIASEKSVVTASATPDGKYLALAYDFGEADILTLENMNTLRTLDISGIERISFLDNNRFIVYCYDRFQIYTFRSFVSNAILSNCLFDKEELSEGTEGIRYRVGSTSYTLPCGSPIPEGSVCTCNCVAVGPSPTYYYSGGSYYVSYWYPN